MSLKFNEKEITNIEKLFKIEQEHMENMIKVWVERKHEELEEEKKNKVKKTIHKPEDDFTSEKINSKKDDDLSVTKKNLKDDFFPDKEDNTKENYDENSENVQKNEKKYEISGDISKNEKNENPNDFLTIAIKIGEAIEVKTITKKEAKEIEDYAILLEWESVIPDNPKVSDFESIIKKSSIMMKENLNKYRESPSIKQFTSNANANEDNATNNETKAIESDGGSISDLLCNEEQIDAENNKDIEFIIEDSSMSNTDDEQPPSIVDLISAEKNEQLDVVNEVQHSNDDDFVNELDSLPSDGCKSDTALEEEKETPRKEIPTLEGELEYYPDDKQIMEQLDTTQHKLKLLDNNEKNVELSVPAIVQNNSEVTEIHEDETILIGDDYDVISKIKEVKEISYVIAKAIIEKQIKEIAEQQSNIKNILGEEPLTLLESKQQLIENRNADADEIIEAEMEIDTIPQIRM